MQRRFGISRSLTVAILAIVLALAAVAIALRVRGDDVQLVHRAKPAFTLLYPGHAMRRVAPRRGELARLEAHRPGLALSVTVRPLRLPAYHGGATAVLPLHAEAQIKRLRRLLDGFEFRGEGRSRVADLPGYQFRFRAGSSRRVIHGRDVLLVPDRPGARDGVVLGLLQTSTDGTLDDADLALIDVVKEAFRSLQFGSERS